MPAQDPPDVGEALEDVVVVPVEVVVVVEDLVVVVGDDDPFAEQALTVP